MTDLSDLARPRAWSTRAAPAASLYAGAALVLLAWSAYLDRTLAGRMVVAHWSGTWVGFDVVLAACLALTALGLRREARSSERLAALCAGLLVADAWFDLATARGTGAIAVAGALALAVELPFAALLLATGVEVRGHGR